MAEATLKTTMTTNSKKRPEGSPNIKSKKTITSHLSDVGGSSNNTMASIIDHTTSMTTNLGNAIISSSWGYQIFSFSWKTMSYRRNSL